MKAVKQFHKFRMYRRYFSGQLIPRVCQPIQRLTCVAFTAWALSAYSDDNVTNERIPLSAEELQDHWQVDCEKLLSQLHVDATNHTLMENIKNDQNQFLEKLQLCSAVHERFWRHDALCNPFKIVLIWYKSIESESGEKLIKSSRSISHKLKCKNDMN